MLLRPADKKETLRHYLKKLREILNSDEMPMNGEGISKSGSNNPIPSEPGVYVIRRKGTGQCVWVGMSKDLYHRIWTQHRNGWESSDLQKVVTKKIPQQNDKSARKWIEKHCMVRWMVIRNEKERSSCEHFFTAMLKPQWAK